MPSLVAALLVGLALLAGSFLLRPLEIRDADVFWHLASGRWMMQHRAIPRTDPFSFTATGAWIDHEWLFQLLLRAVQSIGGIWALFALKSLCYTAALALPALWAFRRGNPLSAVVLAAVLCVFAALPFSEYRPLMFSMVLLAGTVELCRGFAVGKRYAWFALPLLFVIWANAHATFLLGLAAIGGFAAFHVRTAATAQRWASVILLCAVATLFNPYGFHVWSVPFKVTGSTLFMSANQEWRRPDASREFWGAYVLIATLIAAAVSGRSWRSPDSLLALALGIAVCTSRRMIPYFAVAALPSLSTGLSSLKSRLSARSDLLINTCSAILLLSGSWWALPIARIAEKVIHGPDNLPVLNGAFPVDCAATLQATGTTGNLFNDYNHGGFLHYAVGPAWKVYIDGRNELFGETTTLKFNAIAMAQGDWRAEFQRNNVQAVLASYDIAVNRPNIALELANDPNWKLVQLDDAGMLYVTSDLLSSATALHAYNAVKPMMLYEEQAEFARKAGNWNDFVQELEYRCGQSRSRIAEQTFVQALMDSNKADRARDVLSREIDYFGPDPMSIDLQNLLNQQH